MEVKYKRLLAGSYTVEINGMFWGEIEQEGRPGPMNWNDGSWWLRFASDYSRAGLLTSRTLRSLKKVVDEHIEAKLPDIHRWLVRRFVGGQLEDPESYETLAAVRLDGPVLVDRGCGGCVAYQERRLGKVVLWVWLHRYAQTEDCGWIGVCQSCIARGWLPDRKYFCRH